MWKMHEIREIIKLFDESSLHELKIDLEGAETQISLKKQEGSVIHNYNSVSIPVATPSVDSLKKVPSSSGPVKKVIIEPRELMEVQKEQPRTIDLHDANLFKIVSPMVGTFYRTPSEDAGPFVNIGDKIEKSTIVCILEAMKLFNEIEAEVNGEVVDILVENGQLVEHGQPLFLIKRV